MTNINRLTSRFRELMHLRAVIGHGSISAAAAEVSLSQSALTRSIGRLEKLLEVRLLERSAKGVVPTIYGEALMGNLNAIDNELRQAVITLDAMRQATTGHLDCGATMGPLAWLIPAAVDRTQTRRSQLRIRVTEGLVSTLLAQLRMGELDLAVVATHNMVPEPDLLCENLGRDKIAIFARRGHPLFDRSVRSLAQLSASEKWIMPRASSGLYAPIADEFARLRAKMPAMSLEGPPVMKSMLEAGWIALANSHILANELKSGQVVPIQGNWSFPETRILLYRKQRKNENPAVTLFVQCLRDVARLQPVVPLLNGTDER
jgi:DNA-binding transcriptional LysR family regulator